MRRLSVCPAWFDVDAAEAVAADGLVAPMDVLDASTRLVDKNLVELDDESGRYRMLETIASSVSNDSSNWRRGSRRGGVMLSTGRRTMASRDRGNHYEPFAVRAAITDITTMLEWAMRDDADLADWVCRHRAGAVRVEPVGGGGPGV